MPNQLSARVIAVYALEATLVLVGLVLLWRFQLNSAAREKLKGARPLGRWNISLPMFMQMVLCVICGGVIFQLGLTQLLHRFVPSIATNPDLWTVVVGSSVHVGGLLGLVVSHFLPDTFDPLPTERTAAEGGAKKLPLSRIALGGSATLVTLMPLITATAFLWQVLLNALHVPIERQELIDIFNKADSRWQIAWMVVFAVVIAPLTEELIFRAGLFRFLRTRVPRWVALCGPAALFAAIHLNIAALLPLFVLSVVFSLAYERTGRILVTVIAHGLFNLNTVIVLLSGIKV